MRSRGARPYSAPGGTGERRLPGGDAHLEALNGLDGAVPAVQTLVGHVRSLQSTSRDSVRTFEGHTGSVCSVFLSGDGPYALSGSWDKTLKLWEVGRASACEPSRDTQIMCVRFPEWGWRYAFWGSNDKTLKLWEVGTGKCLRTFEGHADCVHSVCLSGDGRARLVGKLGRDAEAVGGGYGQVPANLRGTQTAGRIRVSECGRAYALSGSGDKTLKLWEVGYGPVPADLSRTHKWGEYGVPECRRRPAPVGKR